MKRQHFLFSVLIFILAFASLGCKRTVPVQEYTNTNVSAYGDLTADQVGDAIVRGGVRSGWTMNKERPGLVVATLQSRGHSVVVDIPYSANDYVIKYRTSSNLLAEDGQIHRNYNRWVEKLNRNISAELSLAKK